MVMSILLCYSKPIRGDNGKMIVTPTASWLAAVVKTNEK